MTKYVTIIKAVNHKTTTEVEDLGIVKSQIFESQNQEKALNTHENNVRCFMEKEQVSLGYKGCEIKHELRPFEEGDENYIFDKKGNLTMIYK